MQNKTVKLVEISKEVYSMIGKDGLHSGAAILGKNRAELFAKRHNISIEERKVK